MALLYRGAGLGTYWHTTDARLHGFTPHFPGGTPSAQTIIQHIARGSTKSPYISFSRSFGVARAYGLVGSKGIASPSSPGYVYEIDVVDDSVCKVLDPVKEIAGTLPQPWQSLSYQHDGQQQFILGVVDPVAMLTYLQEPCVFPPGSAGTPRSANLSPELELLVRALRDAEVLVYGNIPTSLIRNRYDVY
jgi:hypothetical protein